MLREKVSERLSRGGGQAKGGMCRPASSRPGESARDRGGRREEESDASRWLTLICGAKPSDALRLPSPRPSTVDHTSLSPRRLSLLPHLSFPPASTSFPLPSAPFRSPAMATRRPSTSFQSLSHLDHYAEGELIGQGSFGIIHKVTRKSDGQVSRPTLSCPPSDG